MSTGTTAERLELSDVQGLVVRGYGKLPCAAYVLLHAPEPDGLRRLTRWAVGRVTAGDDSPTDRAVNVAVTADGIRALTGWTDLPDGFSEPFRTGMDTEYRNRILGDTGSNDPRGWLWGRAATQPLHLMVLLYARDAAILAADVEEVRSQARAGGVRVQRVLTTDELRDRDAFGFKDGVSQPTIAGVSDGADPPEALLPGEFVLGYRNEYGQRSERPLLRAAEDPTKLLVRDRSGAPDLGRNGTYLVVRQLRQDVEGFWGWVRQAAGDDEAKGEHLAARIVGRWPSGAPLALAPTADDPALGDVNDFGYHDVDPIGLRCPVGAHVRRVNPRDSLPPRPGTDASLRGVRPHRLVRRGRTYTDGDERGLYFLALNANLARQFEFIQHGWLNGNAFTTLDDPDDPLVGARMHGPSSFTVPGQPVRRRYRDLPQFVQVRGGAYLFLPGLRALQFLAAGPRTGSDQHTRGSDA
ncbi:Dyp-type peroxidase [Cellulomonas sp. URHD0024]|uniref:Dyp-type peroxidase n=1 Tax=Cellulomonas sp. URHD0024 TaxID=1302620 RepID=UPI0004062B4D|nr:Dyp-type peroxidase [Cellulomonas sp. URHD0024]